MQTNYNTELWYFGQHYWSRLGQKISLIQFLCAHLFTNFVLVHLICPSFLSCLVHSLWIAKQRLEHWLKTTLRCCAAGSNRRLFWRFREVGSSINWVRIACDFTLGISQSGKSVPTVLSRSGRILDLVSAVALQTSRMWSKSSVGAGLVPSDWQRRHCGSAPLSLWRAAKQI